MDACTRHEEDLALLAGGDLVPQSRVDEVLAHVGACTACTALLADLHADLDAVRGLGAGWPAAEGAPALADSVLRQVAPHAEHAGAGRRARLERRLTLPLVQWGAVAAGLLVVASATWVALTRDVGGADAARGTGVPQAATPVVTAQAGQVGAGDIEEFRPIHVRRLVGDSVELVWDGDGREAQGGGPAKTYTVLASANPRDFSAAKPVEVAGNHLVATMALPAYRTGDRAVTFFRVQ